MRTVVSAAGVEVFAPEADNEVARFVERNGPGLYALSIRMTDLDAAVTGRSSTGVGPVGEAGANDFRAAFLHPREFGGPFVIPAGHDAPRAAATAMTAGPG